MKVLIVSDSHGRRVHLNQAIKEVGTIDLLIHLGDFEENELNIETSVTCEVAMVPGNNDYYSSLKKEQLLRIGSHTVLLTHGHYYNLYKGIDELKMAAKSKGATIVMFGHTHTPLIDLSTEIIAINPGSISLPRQSDRKPTYIIMEINYKGKPEFMLKHL